VGNTHSKTCIDTHGHAGCGGLVSSASKELVEASNYEVSQAALHRAQWAAEDAAAAKDLAISKAKYNVQHAFDGVLSKGQAGGNSQNGRPDCHGNWFCDGNNALGTTGDVWATGPGKTINQAAPALLVIVVIAGSIAICNIGSEVCAGVVLAVIGAAEENPQVLEGAADKSEALVDQQAGTVFSRFVSTFKSALSGCSFTATTTVATATGSKAIASLKVGDSVEAYDPKTGKTGSHTVTAVMAHTDPVIEHISFGTGSVDTTPNHPFFTLDRGWVDAGSLKIGDKVRTESGGSATVTGFTLDATPSTMWDITVDGAHTFFVGPSAVLVHNFCAKAAGGGGWNPPSGFRTTLPQIKALAESMGQNGKATARWIENVVKPANGLGAADNVVAGPDGELYDPAGNSLFTNISEGAYYNDR
jgi:hypothetical protein